MFKIPFLEHTAVALEITQEVIRWLEVDRLGKKWSLGSFGEVHHNQSKPSILAGLEEIKCQIRADAWQVGISISFALKEILVEEMPYFEEEEDIENWLELKEQEIRARFEESDYVQYQSVQLDEDSRRVIYQVMDGEVVNRYVGYFEEAEILPVLVTSGIIEYGYSQLFEDFFTEDVSGVLVRGEEHAYLNFYDGGLIQNVYTVSLPKNDLEGAVLQADSYLKSEENSLERNMSGIPLVAEYDFDLDVLVVQRKLMKMKPVPSKRGFEELTHKFAGCSGLLTKMFYPALDVFNVVPELVVAEAIRQYDRSELIRTSILLFAPLIFFFLLIFGAGKLVDYKLIESNQIMSRIGDNIEHVSAERESMFESRDHFMEVKSLLEKREIFAPIFELVSNEIGEEVWIETLTLAKMEESGQQARISGNSLSNQSLTRFLDALENREEIGSVQLIYSENIAPSMDRRDNQRSQVPSGTIRFELIFVVK